MFNVSLARSHFPSLSRQAGPAPLIFFDNPAGTQVPVECIEGFTHYFSHSNANVGGPFLTSRETGDLIREARRQAAAFLGAGPDHDIAFGPNMTSMTFAVSRAFGDTLREGDEIVLSRLDHDANVSTWLALRQKGAVIRWIDIHPHTATLNMETATQVIGPRTRLVAIGYASNAFGSINDVAGITAMAHAHHALVFVDAVHYAPHGPIDVQALGADLLVCSAYKFFGPHLGILCGRREVLESLPAYKVRPASNDPPDKWETGTGNFEGLAGLLGTFAYLRSLCGQPDPSDREQYLQTMMAVRAYERSLSDRLIGGLCSIGAVETYGITNPEEFDARVPTASFTVRGREAHAVASELGDAGIFSWAGNHYAVEPLNRLGLTATNRVGLAHYNTEQEIDRFLEVLDALA